MPKTRYVHFRVNPQEHAKIFADAERAGFRVVADYMRHVTLKVDTVFIERKLTEIEKLLREVLKNGVG